LQIFPLLERMHVEMLGRFGNRRGPESGSDRPEPVGGDAAELEPIAAALGILIVVSITV
jgi:hypothetical protein